MPHDYPIDLGKKMDGPMSVDIPTPPYERKKHYPCLYLDWDAEYDLPASGTMEIRFRKKSETTRESDRGTSQSVELDVEAILEVEADKVSKKKDRENGSEALDKYKKELD